MQNPALHNLRLATADDAADLSDIRGACFNKFWTESTFAEMLARPEIICWLIPNTAYVLIQKIPPEAEIISIAVMPDQRRKGIAEHMLRDTSLQLVADGITTLHLEVNEKKIGAQKLYEKLGFTPTGRRPNYYVNSTSERADAILMQLRLQG